jgi:hypothetical protein
MCRRIETQVKFWVAVDLLIVQECLAPNIVERPDDNETLSHHASAFAYELGYYANERARHVWT